MFLKTLKKCIYFKTIILSSNFDLLSGLSDEATESNFTSTAPTTDVNNDLKNNANMFDPFGSLGGGDGSNILGGWGNFSTAPPPNVQSQNNNMEQKPTDPFAGFGKYTFSRICTKIQGKF